MTGAPCLTGAPCPTGAPCLTEEPANQGGGGPRQRGYQRTQVRAADGYSFLEVAAAATLAQVPTELASPQDPAIPVGDRSPDLLTVHGSPVGEIVQRAARFEEDLLGCPR
jgi:hypothetical protein